MARIIQINYDEVAATADQFGRQADAVRRLSNYLRLGVEDLQCDGWEGDAANAFFNEMECEIFPALHRLVEALEASKAHALALNTRFREAEEEAAHWFMGGRAGLDVMPGGSAFPDRHLLPEWNEIVSRMQTLAGGPLGFLNLLNDLGIRRIPLLNPISFGLNGVFNLVLDPDNDRLQSVVSGLISDGFSLIPAVGVVSAVSDVVQAATMIDRIGFEWQVQNLRLGPEVTSNLETIAGRHFVNMERLDVSQNILEPIGDIGYHTFFTPHMEAYTNFRNNPGLETYGRMLQVGVTSAYPPYGPIINAMASPRAAAGVSTGFADLGRGLGGFVQGALTYHETSTDYYLARGAATLIRQNDTWAIPPVFERTIDAGATWFVDRIANGMIPGVNIPLIPVF
jgi:WXG100 family type VII secretion target